MKMGSLASASNTGDQVDNQEEGDDTSMVTDKASSPSPKKFKDDQVKVEIKSEDFKDVQKVMVVEVEVKFGDGEQVKSEEIVKTENPIKKEEEKDEEDEIVDVEEDEEDGNMEESVNVAEMPTEGPQEIEEEQKEEESIKDVESASPSSSLTIIEEKDNKCSVDASELSKISTSVLEEEVTNEDTQEDNQEEGDMVEDTSTNTTCVISSSSKELQFEEDIDEDVVEAMECIANHVSSENFQDHLTPPVSMETEEDEDDGTPISVETTRENEEASPSPCSQVTAPETEDPVPETDGTDPETDVPAPEIEVPAPEVVVPAPEIVVPAPEIVVPAPEIEVPAPEIEVPAPEVVVPAPEIVVPAPEIEVPAPAVVVPAPEIVPVPISLPPVVEVDPEVAHLKKEMNRLQAALIWERGSKAELSNKLKKSQEELAFKTKNLNIAENKLWERTTAVASLAERDLELKTLQDSFDKINDEKGVLQRKYDHLQNSLADIGKEFYGIYETLQNHFKICTVNGPEMVPLTPHEALQRRVDDLTTSVHERYKFWNAEQHQMSEELGDTKKTMEELIDFLEVAEEKKPPPPPETADRATSPGIPSPKQTKQKAKKKRKKEFKCNLCRNSFSNASILKRHRRSCSDAVAGTSSSSNPTTPAPAVNDSDSDDIAIIEDDYSPVSPTPPVIDSSDDEHLASPKNSTSIPLPVSSPPIVMSKIALSFAPPSIPPSSPRPSKKRQSSASITVVDEVDMYSPPSSSSTTTGKHTRTRKRLDERILSRDEKVSEKPNSAKKDTKKKKIPTPPSSPTPPPSPPSLPPPSSPPPKKKKKKKKSKAKIIGHAEDPTKEDPTCTCGKDFINKYHLKTHIEKEAANPTIAPPTEKSPKVVAIVNASNPEVERKQKQTSRKVKEDVEETEEKTKKRTISISDEEPEPLEEETSLRSSKRLKKIKETTPIPAKDDVPASPSPRTRRQGGSSGHARSPKKTDKPVDVPTRSPKKSPKKGIKEQDRSSKKVVHEQDHSKSARRGLFCKCGLTFQSSRKLRIHIFCRKNVGGGEGEEKEETGNANGVRTFICGSCGENFESNAERIKHRVLTHGHGLNT